MLQDQGLKNPNVIAEDWGAQRTPVLCNGGCKILFNIIFSSVPRKEKYIEIILKHVGDGVKAVS